MALDALAFLYSSTADLTSATNVSSWFDLKTGTPRRGMPVQLLIRPDVTASSTTGTATMAGTLPVATVTLETTEDTSGAVYTIASYVAVSGATGTSRQTEIATTSRRYLRAKIILGGTSPTLLANAFHIGFVAGGKPS